MKIKKGPVLYLEQTRLWMNRLFDKEGYLVQVKKKLAFCHFFQILLAAIPVEVYINYEHRYIWICQKRQCIQGEFRLLGGQTGFIAIRTKFGQQAKMPHKYLAYFPFVVQQFHIFLKNSDGRLG